jgi:hypothetical protein
VLGAYNLLDAYTYGFALEEKTIPFETPEQSVEIAEITVGERGSAYPCLAEVVNEFATSGGTTMPRSSPSASTSSSTGSNGSSERSVREGDHADDIVIVGGRAAHPRWS